MPVLRVPGVWQGDHGGRIVSAPPLVAILQLPMDLDAFADITAAIAKHYPDATLGEADDDQQIVVRQAASNMGEDA